MKISFNWLSDYIDLKEFRENTDELSRILTQAGLEVEGMENQKEKYKNVVIGFIKELKEHPDADKLTVCTVDVGEPNSKQIICGAKNHKAGDYVVTALPGAVLPGDFKIKSAKIRGVESHGMLCSEKELGLSEESEGIITMKEGKIGQLFADAFEKNDIIFELNVTPNRADCLSHIGLAQELSALLDRPVFKPKIKLKTAKFKTTAESDINLRASALCPRYAGMMLKGVKVGPSPRWLKQRLEVVDVRSINNIVDVTNYVLFEYGQPLHAFDWSQIKGEQITIRMSEPKEKFTTLDGTDLELTGKELVIADKERAVALAGVVGGQNSGVTESTTDIFVESAFFTALGTRRTSRRFGFETDSSYRFSRGVNPEQTVEAMKRACDLFAEVSGGEIASDWHDVYPDPIKKEPIAVDVNYVAERLGYDIKEKHFFEVMKRLGCYVKGNKVTPPAHRWDLEIQEDLVEEYGRVNGYDQLNETLPILVEEPTSHDQEYLQERKISEFLKGQGFRQSLNYAFTNQKLQKDILGSVEVLNQLGLNSSEPIAVKNPISEDFGVMRTSLLPGLFTNVAHNCRHGYLSGELFELGKTHYQKEDYQEDQRLAFAWWHGDQSLWDTDVKAVYRLKSKIENLLAYISPQKKWEWRSVGKAPNLFHPKQVVSLLWQGQLVGVLGAIHPSLKKSYKLRSDLAFAEFNLSSLCASQKPRKFTNISPYPAVEKDLAFVMPKSMKSLDVIKEIKRAGGQLLTSVEVVDVFEGGNLGENEKSLAFRMTYQSPDKTLADEDVLKLFNRTIDSVQQKLSVQLR